MRLLNVPQYTYVFCVAEEIFDSQEDSLFKRESVAGRAAGSVLGGSGRPSVWVDPGWFASRVGSVFLSGE